MRAVRTFVSRDALPPFGPGMRIGLLGGSFNPPHAAHRAISLFVMRRLRLDRVWWLVTPGNPLKDVRALPALDRRLAAARRVADHPRIDVSDIETVIGTRYTADTISFLRQRCPDVRFAWIMGADNLMQFHRWKDWRGIAEQVPLAVVDRPLDSFRALASPAAQALSQYRLRESDSTSLLDQPLPAWVFLSGMKSGLSSTGLRNPNGSWKT